MERFGGTVALVTRAASGIGLTTARRLGAEGALWDEVLAVNLWSSFLGCQKATAPGRRRDCQPRLQRRAHRRAGRARLRDPQGRGAGKGGVLTMTMALAIELAHDRIRVNCVCPGTILPPIPDGIIARARDPTGFESGLAAKHPMGRLGSPEGVAATIAFLASDDASFMTGLAVPVDGGRRIR